MNFELFYNIQRSFDRSWYNNVLLVSQEIVFQAKNASLFFIIFSFSTSRGIMNITKYSVHQIKQLLCALHKCFRCYVTCSHLEMILGKLLLSCLVLLFTAINPFSFLLITRCGCKVEMRLRTDDDRSCTIVLNKMISKESPVIPIQASVSYWLHWLCSHNSWKQILQELIQLTDMNLFILQHFRNL